MNIQRDDNPQVGGSPASLGGSRRKVFVFGGIALLAAVLVLSVFFSNQLFTRMYLRPLRVTVSPTELTQDETLLVIWEESMETKLAYPAEQILACGSSGACQTLIPTTPNDGKERISVSSLAPGRYSIEIRGLDATQAETPTMFARSEEFTIYPRTE